MGYTITVVLKPVIIMVKSPRTAISRGLSTSNDTHIGRYGYAHGSDTNLTKLNVHVARTIA